MNTTIKSVVGVASLALAAHAAAQVTFYEGEDFQGRTFTTERQIGNLERFGFNDRASSVVVSRGRWEVCEDERFSGQCVILRPGRYDSLRSVGLDQAISSVRPAGRNSVSSVTPAPVYGQAPAYVAQAPAYVAQAPTYVAGPAPVPSYSYGRRDNETLYQADVISVRAVVGPPEQRCWVEREQLQSGSTQYNVPGAILGAVIGGVIGHQVGGGRGRDVATGVGAVGGAAVGANVGRDGAYAQDVQRCQNVSNERPDYWDVVYNFRGMEHRVQMTSPPGATVTVNRDGEPRT